MHFWNNLYAESWAVVLHKIPGYTRLAEFVVGFRSEGDMTSRRFPDGEICHVHTGSPGNGETVFVTCHPAGPTHARYVYIYLPGDDRVLTLCEVEVYEFTGEVYAKFMVSFL